MKIQGNIGNGKNNGKYLAILLLFYCSTVIYLSNATANVPMMDYWKYITMLVDKAFTKGISFNDLWNYNGNGNIHRVPFQLWTFLLNASVFHLNTQIAIYAAPVVTAVTMVLIYRRTRRVFEENIWYWAGITLVTAFCFSWNAFEILTLEFSFAFAVRKLLFIVSFFAVNSFLTETEKNKQHAIEIAILFLFTITCFSGAYFAAYGLALSIVIIWDFFRKNREERKKYFFSYIIPGLGLLAGLFLYVYQMDSTSTASLGITFSFRMIIDFVKALTMAAGGMLAGAESPTNLITIAGIIFLAAQAVLLIVFFYQKQYRQSYIPIIISLYVFFLVAELLMGRGNIFSVRYLASSRYLFDFNLIVIADVWIILQSLRQEGKQKPILKKCLSCALMIYLGLGALLVYSSEWKTAPYRKLYYDNLAETLIHADEATDEQLLYYQDDVESVRKGIEIMKKYDLGVFRYTEK
ncbi:MAG: hypothetical protein IKE81_00020 [Clostridia bacterium]|nr:hypothetical protein [Clostridia bacterium]